MNNMWNERYANSEYAYGTAPNEFFKESLEKYKPKGSILLPAEGEGRNAVFAAKEGLAVTAFDLSIEGQKKALKLAKEQNVEINYEVGDFYDLDLINQKFDSAALIFAHFPPPLLAKFYKKIGELINPDGLLILEGFSKSHLPYRKANPEVGGPDNLEMLFSIEFIQDCFPDFETIILEDVEVELNEGLYHQGTGKVIRFIGRKLGK